MSTSIVKKYQGYISTFYCSLGHDIATKWQASNSNRENNYFRYYVKSNQNYEFGITQTFFQQWPFYTNFDKHFKESWDQNQRQYSVDLPDSIILLFHQQTAEQSYCKQKHSSSGCLAQCSIGHFKDLEGRNNYFQQELCSQYYMKEWDSKQIEENKIEDHQPKVNLVTKNLHKSYPAKNKLLNI